MNKIKINKIINNNKLNKIIINIIKIYNNITTNNRAKCNKTHRITNKINKYMIRI